MTEQEDTRLMVVGGRPLAGEVLISGSKNASLPVMAASLLTDGEVWLENLPQVSDVRLMADILGQLGAQVALDGDRVRIRAHDVGSTVDDELGRRMRASIVLLGALLARTGSARLPRPGGDQIGARRVEQHIRGLRAMGAEVEEGESEMVARAPGGLRGTRVIFDLPTVTGTENIMLAATLARGRTEILNAAREPHVVDLARFLNSMGGAIAGAGSDKIVVDGVDRLSGAHHRLVPDYLEAGTYALAALAAGGRVRLVDCPAEDLEQLFMKLEESGASIYSDEQSTTVARPAGSRLRPVDMCTFVHPGFPTDLQAQYLAAMTQADGESVISEYLFENRFQHVPELRRMGAEVVVRGRDAFVRGPSRLRGTHLTAPDIRSGASLVIAALCAEGESRIDAAWHIARGYEDMPGKLARLGARIESRRGAVPASESPQSSYE